MPISETDILRLRLANQQVSQSRFSEPGPLVGWMGAMQAQDFNASKWAIALRVPGNSERDIEQAIHDRQIIRTWSLRGTLHFTAPGDIRWIASFILPRLASLYAFNLRLLELDKTLLKKTTQVILRALEGRQPLSRSEIKKILGEKGFPIHEMRFSFILRNATHEGLICFGPRKNKEFTHVLLDEWIPPTPKKDPDEALAELAKRYFSSHGPATLQDFAWWAGLTLTDTKRAIDINDKSLKKINTKKQDYWMGVNSEPVKINDRRIYLLPAFDEYLVAYADRSLALDPVHSKKVLTPNGIFKPIVVINNKVTATWKKGINKKTGPGRYSNFRHPGCYAAFPSGNFGQALQ